MSPDDFITRMTVLYGPPDTVDNEMFLDEYRAVLNGNAPELIKRAGDIIRDTQVRRFWPTPAEVKEAIRKAAYHFSAYVPAEHKKFDTFELPIKTQEQIEEEAASKARVNKITKAFVTAMRGPPKADKPVELPWMSPDDFAALMEKVPDRPAAKRAEANGGFVKVSDVKNDITKRMLGERD